MFVKYVIGNFIFMKWWRKNRNRYPKRTKNCLDKVVLDH